jgi:hypothetical protein
MSNLTSLSLSKTGMGPKICSRLATSFSAAVLTSVNCLKNPLGDEGLATLVTAVEASSVGSICGLTEGQTTVDWSKQKLGPFDCKMIAADFGIRRFSAAIEKVNVSGCDVTQEGAAQLLTTANEASRARLRAHQVLAFSEALHARLGSECLLQAVAIDADVWHRVAQIVRERHGHELMCARLAQPCSRAWLRVRQVLAFSKIVHARLGSECLLQVMEIDAEVWRHVAENVHERHGHEAICSRLAQPWFEVTVEVLIPEGIPVEER